MNTPRRATVKAQHPVKGAGTQLVGAAIVATVLGADFHVGEPGISEALLYLSECDEIS